MTCFADPDPNAYASILSDQLKDVADELRTIDLIDLATLIHGDSFVAIDDLLQSSTELFFKEGTLTFAWSAGIKLEWGDLPHVKLGLEFQHLAVSVFFDLYLNAISQTVSVGGVLFDAPLDDGLTNAGRLVEALADARLPSRGMALPGPRAASIEPGER